MSLVLVTGHFNNKSQQGEWNIELIVDGRQEGKLTTGYSVKA